MACGRSFAGFDVQKSWCHWMNPSMMVCRKECRQWWNIIAFSSEKGCETGLPDCTTLFSILFAAVLTDAFWVFNWGVYIQFQSNGKVLNIQRLQAKTKMMKALIWEFIFADNCAQAAHSNEDNQCIMDYFSAACRHFSFSISLSKTEPIYHLAQSKASDALQSLPIVTNGIEIESVEKFCFLGSTLCNNWSLDTEVAQYITKASSAFGLLTQTLARMQNQAAGEDSSVPGSSLEFTIIQLWNKDSVLSQYPAAWAVQLVLFAHHLQHQMAV